MIPSPNKTTIMENSLDLEAVFLTLFLSRFEKKHLVIVIMPLI